MFFRFLTIAVLLGWCQAVLADSAGREHIVPLFMAADDPNQRQGFLRIINHSDKAGSVTIYGIDDNGTKTEPATLQLDALETKHINSGHVEDGDESRGLSPGIGDGSGNWRLTLSSEDLDIEPLAYIRTTFDGFLTSTHDIASQAGMQHHVPVFNPGRNTNQESWLRVINLGTETANITITGRDDAGVAGGEVMETVPAGGAYSATAAEIEEAGLKEGTGKWSLMVTADQPVQVMSLMNTPSGHLSNLSGAKRNYVGAAGMWKVAFADGNGGDGYILLLPDSRLYAWLPESAELVRVARAAYSSHGASIEASGVVYENNKVEQDGIEVSGGSEAVEFDATYRSGDWISGTYTVGGAQRAFHGWAFTGFDRGGSAAALAGPWCRLGDGLLPGQFKPDATGAFDDVLIVPDTPLGELECSFDGTLGPVNPAFNAHESIPEINCSNLLIFDRGTVEMIMALMDSPGMAGKSDHAVMLSMIPDDRAIAFGALYEHKPELDACPESG